MLLFPAEWDYTCELCAESHWTPVVVSAVGAEVTNNRMVVCGTCHGLIHAAANEPDPEKSEQLLRQIEHRRERHREEG